MNKSSLISYIKKLRKITGASIISCKEALLLNNNDLNKAIEYLNIYGIGNKLNIKYKKINQGIILDKIINIDQKYYLGYLIELGCETDFVAKNKEFYIAAKKILNFVIKEKITDIKLLQTKFNKFLITLMNKFSEKIQITKLYNLVGKYITSYNHNKRIGVLISLKSKQNNIYNISNMLPKQIAMHIAATKPLYINYHDIPKHIINNIHAKELSLALKTGKPQNIVNKIVQNKMDGFIKDICLNKQKFIFDDNIIMENLCNNNNIILDSYIRIELGKDDINNMLI